MHFENCDMHEGQVRKIVVQCEGRFEIVCKECFGGGMKGCGDVGVVLSDGAMQYFSQWNQFLITELQSYVKIISEQGADFLIKAFNQNQNKEFQTLNGDILLNDSASKSALLSIILQHIDILTKNITFMPQQKSFLELNNEKTLRDLFIITTKTVQHILEPFKKEFQSFLKRQFNKNCQIEWKQDAINEIETARQQIFHDWAQNCLLKKAVFTSSISKTQSDENDKVQTQHSSINQSRSSCVSLSFDEEIQKIDLSSCGEFDIGNQDHEIIDRTQSYVIDTKKENQMLLRLLKTKEEEIQNLNAKLAESQKSCLEWMKKYDILQQSHKKIVQERISAIELQFDSLERIIGAFTEENDQFFHQIQQLEQKLLSLTQENQQLRSQISDHNINPFYEKRKIEEKFLTQIIELQSQNLLKNDDLQMMISFLRLTKNTIQSLTFQNWKEFAKNWQKQMIERVNSLQTVTIKQL